MFSARRVQSEGLRLTERGHSRLWVTVGTHRNSAENKLPGTNLNFREPGKTPLRARWETTHFRSKRFLHDQESYKDLICRVLDAVQAHPGQFKKTAVFITFDEGGGYWDSGSFQPIDFFGDGPRIPFIVVSDYSRGGRIVHSMRTPHRS